MRRMKVAAKKYKLSTTAVQWIVYGVSWKWVK